MRNGKYLKRKKSPDARSKGMPLADKVKHY